MGVAVLEFLVFCTFFVGAVLQRISPYFLNESLQGLDVARTKFRQGIRDKSNGSINEPVDLLTMVQPPQEDG